MLYGEVPPDIGLNFTELEVFAGGLNKFTGPIPVSLSNASWFALLEFSGNGLNGTIPTGLGILHHFYRLNFETLGRNGNMDLRGSIFESLSKLQGLQGLELDGNKFSGRILSSFGNLTMLTTLYKENNRLEY
ncbi:unnamed protein product [Withania somnifera]